MATTTSTARSRPSTVRTRARATRRTYRPRHEPAVGDVRAREAGARAGLAVAISRAEQTYAIAARRFAEFEAYLIAVHVSLRRAGYLDGAPRRADSARRG